MGYNLTIQREEAKQKITVQEWKSSIETDPEIEAIEVYSATFPNVSVISIPTPSAGLWSSAKMKVPFLFSDKCGGISVKNPSFTVVAKMIAIANQLDAVVLGEEGERYDEAYYRERKRAIKN